MSTPTGPDPQGERRVRDALHDTVDDLEPVSGLSAIRSRPAQAGLAMRTPSTSALGCHDHGRTRRSPVMVTSRCILAEA